MRMKDTRQRNLPKMKTESALPNHMASSYPLWHALENLLILLIALPVALPLMGIIALSIRLSSPGPIMFYQKRIGQHGRPFTLFKFRTMYPDSQRRLKQYLHDHPEAQVRWECYHKLPDDPRITPIGRWLRRTSLDELPQLFNVLKGDMNIIGPRPVLPAEFRQHYQGEARTFYTSVKPGITGLWQIAGRSTLDFPTRVFLDVWYVRHWSLWLDLYILMHTVRVLISRTGAY